MPFVLIEGSIYSKLSLNSKLLYHQIVIMSTQKVHKYNFKKYCKLKKYGIE